MTIMQAPKKEGKKGLTYAQMEEFISMHRNAAELKATFEKVKKLSRIQPMPYKYVKTWFDNRFPYFADQPSLDEDGFVVDSASFENAAAMVREVEDAMKMKKGSLIAAEAEVA